VDRPLWNMLTRAWLDEAQGCRQHVQTALCWTALQAVPHSIRQDPVGLQGAG